MQTPPVLVTGATGYVGGRLVPRLLEAGGPVRALGRSLKKLRSRPWGNHPLLELAQGDVMDADSLTRAAPAEVWQAITRVGGQTGWYYGDSLWAIRGWVDRLLGGSGLRRGRRHPTEIQTGDALDFFRVLEVDPGERLLLVAEMKMPGEATLEFRLSPQPDGVTELTQIARFLPRGLMGILYWHSLDPFHRKIYQGMLQGIAQATGRPVIAGPERVGGE